MYQYLSASVLTGDNKKDRMILLLSDQFYLRNDLLWKLSLPRNKTEQRLRPMSERLCVPKIFRHEILDYFHQHLGHLGTERLFFTLAYRAYTVDSTDLELRLPRRVVRPVNDQTDHSVSQPTDIRTPVVPADSPVDTSMSPAVRILRERVRAKQKEYLVLFPDKTQWWCNDVTPD